MIRTIRKARTVTELLILVVIDAATILFIMHLALYFRVHIAPRFSSRFPGEDPRLSWGFVAVVLAMWLFFMFYEGLYQKARSFWDEVRVLWKVIFFSTVGIFAFASMGKFSDRISRTVIVVAGISSLILLPAVRITAKALLRRIGLFKRRVIILGAGKTGELIAGAISNDPNYGYELSAFIDDDPEKEGTLIRGVKVHSGVDMWAQKIQRLDISDVILAMPGIGKDRLAGLINLYQHKAARILFVPDLFGIAVFGTNLQHFFNEQALVFELKNNLANPINLALKRLTDILFCIFVLPFLLVPLSIMMIVIRLSSKGPALYTQERIGRDLKPFKCYKFRTMYDDADGRLKVLLEQSAAAREEWEHYRKLKDDPRVTRVGRLLRVTSMDELPQVFNVLKGEMSLVGPRPVTQEEIDDNYRENADLCFSVPPGMTGLWQVSGRSTTTYGMRIRLDAWYVKNWNLWLDFIILLRTVRALFNRNWAA
ncbi:MAG: undecaprenyl-phosphate galactose phosphotransferase WbaP [Myxococcota bacterium]|jgi:undecaprenyl-phosphate galactose phosphotransferase